MADVGKNQLDLLAKMVGTRAIVVGDALVRSLSKRGLMTALGEDSFYVVTPAGLRAVADAIDAGTLPALTIEDFKPKGGAS